jgi:hypothetical protein
MSYPINYPTPQGANIQIFKEGGTTSDWVKPQGASFVWFTLIGSGGGGGVNDGSIGSGGGSGAVTNFMCPAFLIPDVLNVKVGLGSNYGSAGTATQIIYQQKDGTGYVLIFANGGNSGQTLGEGGIGGSGGTAQTFGAFIAMGFLNSQNGANGADYDGGGGTATNTFLSGGNSDTVSSGYYGYVSQESQGGYFQIQPIITSVPPARNQLVGRPTTATGCGGSPNGFGAAATKGGDGMAVIITW